MLCALLLLAAYVVPAHAADGVTLGVRDTYVPGDVTVPQGSTFTLINAENSPHDVLAVDIGPDGRPLFQADSIQTIGQTTRVVGLETLETGSYPFYCSYHDTMVGTVTVT